MLFQKLIKLHRVYCVVAHTVDFAIAAARRGENPAGKVLRLIQDRLSDAEFGKNLANLSNRFAASVVPPDFEFQIKPSIASAAAAEMPLRSKWRVPVAKGRTSKCQAQRELFIGGTNNE